MQIFGILNNNNTGGRFDDTTCTWILKTIRERQTFKRGKFDTALLPIKSLIVATAFSISQKFLRTKDTMEKIQRFFN